VTNTERREISMKFKNAKEPEEVQILDYHSSSSSIFLECRKTIHAVIIA
jgi:hypothetical protein